MATFYIQLENKLLQISGELTAENISKALGYVPVSPTVTNELSQRVDNITFDSLKDNPFLQDGSGELNIVDEAGNIIAKIDVEGIHSVDFIAGEHRLSNKTDKTYVDEAVKNVKVDLTGYATEEYVNNIDFYNIKDNPIVNNGDGKLLFVDENGYIGLQLEENGLYVKDVIADGHTLSQKANKSDIPSLDGYATESYVNTNLQNYATKDEVSDLVDMSVVTELQGKVNTLVGEDSDKSVRTIANEELAALLLAGNDNLQSLLELAAWIDEHPEDASAMNEAIQTNTSNITKLDSAYKEADVKVLTDANEYTDNINFYTIKDNPIVNGEAGSLTFVDETGYISLKVTEEGIIVKDVVTPEHKLSDKANASDIPTKVSQLQNDANYITTADIPSLDEYVTETELNDKGYLTEHLNISHLASKEELNNIDFYSLQNNPVVNTEEGKLLFVDESGNIGLQLEADNTLYVKDVVGNGHILSSKQDILVSGTNIKTINGESILGSGDIVINSSSEETVIDDGVYAVTSDEKLINYTTANDSCIGVALVAGEHTFMIAKADATDGTNTTLYWTKSYSDLSLTNYSNADGTNSYGYLPKPDGTYYLTPNLSDDFTTWTNGALSDFNGKDNTAVIAAASSHTKDMCTVLNTFNQTEQTAGRSADWYVPACGQLALMYLANTDINAALAKIGGTAFESDTYWSSSESSADLARHVYFGNGNVGGSSKYGSNRVRFIRDISVSKPLKERVSDLESNKQDTIKDLDAIRDGASKGATALQEEQYKGTVTSVTAGNGLTGGSIIESGTISMPSVITAGTKGNTDSIQLIPSKTNCSATTATGKVIGSITVDEFGRVVDIKECFINLTTIYPKEVTTSYSGLMTASDKSKLNQCITSSEASTTYATKTSLNNKQDKLVNGTNIKTINGESILGSGDIVIEGGSSGGGAYAEVSHGTGETTFTLTPNTFHVWDEVTSLDLSFVDETAGVANEYLFQFTSGTTATTLTLPDVKWANDSAPNIAENMIYQVSVLKGLGVWVEF